MKMKIFLFLFITIIAYSCFNDKIHDKHRLVLNKENIEKFEFYCLDSLIELDRVQIDYILDKIDQAKNKGLIKGIVKQRMKIRLNNGDSIKISLLGNKFKWNKSHDWTFELDIERDYFDNLCK